MILLAYQPIAIALIEMAGLWGSTLIVVVGFYFAYDKYRDKKIIELQEKSVGKSAIAALKKEIDFLTDAYKKNEIEGDFYEKMVAELRSDLKLLERDYGNLLKFMFKMTTANVRKKMQELFDNEEENPV